MQVLLTMTVHLRLVVIVVVDDSLVPPRLAIPPYSNVSSFQLPRMSISRKTVQKIWRDTSDRGDQLPKPRLFDGPDAGLSRPCCCLRTSLWH
eukprot:3144643-Rhodomonas_salina.1